MARKKKTIGIFHLDGIPPPPRGVPQIEVTFDIDANGILNVKAKDKATNKEQSIKITASSGLSKEEVEKMKQEAELHADEDKKKQELIEVRNLADTMVYASEKMMKEVEEKKIAITDDEKKNVEEGIRYVKDVKDKDDVEAIKKASEALSKSAQVVGAKMYAANQPPQGGQSGAPAGEQPAGEAPKTDEQGPIEGEVVK